MPVPCDPGALIRDSYREPMSEERIRAEFLEAASCSGPVESGLVREAGMAPSGDPAGVIDVQAVGLDVWIDGAPGNDPTQVARGFHLVQLFPEGADQAAGGALLWVSPGQTATILAADLDGEVRTFTCDDRDQWLLEVERRADGTGADDALGLLTLPLLDCAGTTEADRWREAVAIVEIGARLDDPALAADGIAKARSLDEAAWISRERGALRTAKWARVGAVAGAGIAGAGVYAAVAGHDQSAAPALIVGTTTLLGSVSVQRGRLMDAGRPTSGGGLAAGWLLLGAGLATGRLAPDTGVWDYPPVQGAPLLPVAALATGLVQVALNEASLRR